MATSLVFSPYSTTLARYTSPPAQTSPATHAFFSPAARPASSGHSWLFRICALLRGTLKRGPSPVRWRYGSTSAVAKLSYRVAAAPTPMLGALAEAFTVVADPRMNGPTAVANRALDALLLAGTALAGHWRARLAKGFAQGWQKPIAWNGVGRRLQEELREPDERRLARMRLLAAGW